MRLKLRGKKIALFKQRLFVRFWRPDIRYNDTLHIDNQHIDRMTLSIMMLSSKRHSAYDNTQYIDIRPMDAYNFNTQQNSYYIHHCHYAECCWAQCLGTKIFLLICFKGIWVNLINNLQL